VWLGRSGFAEDPVELRPADRASALRHATTGLADLDLTREVALLLALHAVGLAGVLLGHLFDPS